MKRNRYIQKIDIDIRNNFVNRNSDVIVNRESDVHFCDVNGDSGYCSWAEVMVMLLIMMWKVMVMLLWMMTDMIMMWNESDVAIRDVKSDGDVMMMWMMTVIGLCEVKVWCYYSWCECDRNIMVLMWNDCDMTIHDVKVMQLYWSDVIVTSQFMMWIVIVKLSFKIRLLIVKLWFWCEMTWCYSSWCEWW